VRRLALLAFNAVRHFVAVVAKPEAVYESTLDAAA